MYNGICTKIITYPGTIIRGVACLVESVYASRLGSRYGESGVGDTVVEPEIDQDAQVAFQVRTDRPAGTFELLIKIRFKQYEIIFRYMF